MVGRITRRHERLRVRGRAQTSGGAGSAARGFAARASPAKPGRMSEHVYKHLELTGSSTTSIQAAIENAIHRAAETVRNMRWFEVTDTRGHIVDGKVGHWQVTLKIGFTLEE